MGHPIRVLIAVLVAVGLAGCDGCKETPKVAQKEEAVDAGVPEDTGPPVDPLLLKRQAFGLPIPPEVVAVREGLGFVEVQTLMKIDELEGFFRTRLVDYEYFHPAKYRMDVVGLFEHMPRIRVVSQGSFKPVKVRYMQSFEKLPRATTGAKPEAEVEKGDAVEIKTRDGEDLAPGARYGMPYTPPPESPLHQERYRPNFGKKFGEWQLN